MFCVLVLYSSLSSLLVCCPISSFSSFILFLFISKLLFCVVCLSFSSLFPISFSLSLSFSPLLSISVSCFAPYHPFFFLSFLSLSLSLPLSLLFCFLPSLFLSFCLHYVGLKPQVIYCVYHVVKHKASRLRFIVINTCTQTCPSEWHRVLSIQFAIVIVSSQMWIQDYICCKAVRHCGCNARPPWSSPPMVNPFHPPLVSVTPKRSPVASLLLCPKGHCTTMGKWPPT